MSQAFNDWQIGQETKLSERFMGKQVYAKLIDFGSLPHAYQTKRIPHGVTGMDRFGIDTSRSHAIDDDGLRHGLNSPGTHVIWRSQVDQSNIYISCNQERTNIQAFVCLWYTKLDEESGEIPLPFGPTEEEVQRMIEEALSQLPDPVDYTRIQQMINDAIAALPDPVDYALVQQMIDAAITAIQMPEPVDWTKVQQMIDNAKPVPATETSMGIGYVATEAEAKAGMTDAVREGNPAFITPEGLGSVIAGLPGRTIIQGDFSLYVRPDGNDTNDGLENTPERALRSWDGVRRIKQQVYTAGNIKVYFSPGNYEHLNPISSDWSGEKNLYLIGDGAILDSAFTVNACFELYCYVVPIIIQGSFTIHAGTGWCFYQLDTVTHFWGADLTLIGDAQKRPVGIEFDSALRAYALNSKFTFKGDFKYTLASNQGSTAFIRASTLIFDEVTVLGESVIACFNSYLEVTGSPCSGSVTGKRYAVAGQALINTGGAGEDFFPGTEPGTVHAASGGFYA